MSKKNRFAGLGDCTPQEFVEHVRAAWSPYGTITTAASVEWGKPATKVYVVTGGHSKNERLQSDLDWTMFHFAFWRSSHRGGLVVYEVPGDLWESSEPTDWGCVV